MTDLADPCLHFRNLASEIDWRSGYILASNSRTKWANEVKVDVMGVSWSISRRIFSVER